MKHAELDALSLADLYRELTRDGSARRLLQLARDEDLGSAGDITSDACISETARASARLVARGAGVIAGLAAMGDLVALFAPDIVADARMTDGERVARGDVVASFDGPARQMLGLERTMLNLLSRLSGIATATGAYVAAVRDARPPRPVKVLDTRKTVPGLRALSKYAVCCGGGHCHRVGLFDAVLIKDNHLAGVGVDELAGFVTRAAERARRAGAVRFVEVEVTTLEQLGALLALPGGVVDIVLLDNMDTDMLRRAAARRDEAGARVLLEASGGVTLETIGEIARTGVDQISVGAITHSAPALDLALEFD